MIYSDKNLKEEIIELLNTEEYNIVFGSLEILEESKRINSKNIKGLYIFIRNRYSDGTSNHPIPHQKCTVKLIRGNIYNGPGNMKGLPFEIEPKLKLYKNADNDNNRKLLQYYKKDFKFLKQIVEENYEDILKYWNADPNTLEGLKIIKDIETKIEQKYRK